MSSPSDKDTFYPQLESVLDRCSRGGTLLVMGDFNASTGTDRMDRLDVSRLRNEAVANYFMCKLHDRLGRLPARVGPEVMGNFFKAMTLSVAGERLTRRCMYSLCVSRSRVTCGRVTLELLTGGFVLCVFLGLSRG
jgi:hypothetical protein